MAEAPVEFERPVGANVEARQAVAIRFRNDQLPTVGGYGYAIRKVQIARHNARFAARLDEDNSTIRPILDARLEIKSKIADIGSTDFIHDHVVERAREVGQVGMVDGLSSGTSNERPTVHIGHDRFAVLQEAEAGGYAL
jgi:hypothetical protein